MTARHHPSEDLLLAYAAGSLDEPRSLLVATHLALCPHCRAVVSKAEAIGGTLLDTADAAPMSAGALQSVLARLDDDQDAGAGRPIRVSAKPEAASSRIPEPLRGYLEGRAIDSLSWRRVAPGIRRHDLSMKGTAQGGEESYLLRLEPEVVVPRHGHHGEEMTLVLEGGFTDNGAHFERGDVEQADGSIEHQPIVDPGEPCVTLVVTDGPLRFTGLLPRLLRPIFDR